MATTRNGWTTAPALRTAIRAPGCADTGDVRAGDVARVMQAFANAFDAEVEPLTTINGYRSPELNAAVGGDPRSNHLSATALDFNGGRHPYEANLPAPQRGAAYTHGFTAAQVKAIRELLKRFGGVIAWGLDFNTGYRDAMHFEIRGTATQVAAAAAQLHTPEEDDVPTAQEIVDELMARPIVAGDAGLPQTAAFGALIGDIAVHARKGAQLAESVSENRRMLGVLLGWQAPAPNSPEADALAALRSGSAPTAAVLALADELLRSLPPAVVTALRDALA